MTIFSSTRPKTQHSVCQCLKNKKTLYIFRCFSDLFLLGLIQQPISVTDEEITEMVLFPTINEACRVLDEGVVARASDLDVASVLGMSFPSYCGGIMFWADTVGSKHIYLSLKKWSEWYGSYFKPSRYLEERAMKGMPL
ncbi:hypothetical protein ERO13_D12G092450v2, partial [Gossypium hirsutum]